MLYTLLQILSLAALGFLLRRYWGWSQEFFRLLSRFLVRIVLPVYLFVRISQTDPADIRAGSLFPFAAVLIVGFGLLVSRLAASALRLPAKERGAALAMSGFGNSAIMPLLLIEILPVTLPLVTERFGIRTPTLYVGAYVLIQSPFLWSLGNYLVRGRQGRPRLKEVITPPLIGIMAGLLFLIPGLQSILMHRDLPFYHIHSALGRIGAGAFPLILLCLGSLIADLKAHNTAPHVKAAALVAGMRFLIVPALFFASYFLLMRRLGLSPAVVWVLFLESHTPPATNLSIMAIGENEDVVSLTLLVTYLGYLVVLPVYLLLFLSLPGVL